MQAALLQIVLDDLQHAIDAQLTASEAPGGVIKSGVTARIILTGSGNYQTARSLLHVPVRDHVNIVGDATFSISTREKQFNYIISTCLRTAGLNNFMISIIEMCTLFNDAGLFETLQLSVSVEAAYVFAMTSDGDWLEE